MKLNLPTSCPERSKHRGSRCSGRFGILAGTLAAVLIVAAAALIHVHALKIQMVRKNKVVYLHKIVAGDRFSTSYVHSVELSPVQEYYGVDYDYRMVLGETTFRSSNVGLPYAAFGAEVFHMEKDGFRISNMHRIIPQLLIWADRRYDNRLQFRDHDIALYGFEGDGLIQVGIENLRLGRFVMEKAMVWTEGIRKHGQEE